jgi:hypothetical protein
MLALLSSSFVACVGPARTFGAYEGKAGATAEAMVSAIETARLAAQVSAKNNAFAPYLSVTIAQAEEEATSVQGAFNSIQPPDHDADQLRKQLDALLGQAVSAISDMRIAARRGDFSSVERVGQALRALSEQLDSFAEAHT